MERSEFERLVLEALNAIPEGLYQFLDNVDVVVEDWPTMVQLAISEIGEGEFLLGLYDGVPLTARQDYGDVLPDKITIFQKSIESVCDSNDEIVEQVYDTVVHEVAHHFGVDDERLQELGIG